MTCYLDSGQMIPPSMALCLAESLVEQKGFNPKDQMERYVRWYQNGHLSSTETCFDIGTSTELALKKHIATWQAFLRHYR